MPLNQIGPLKFRKLPVVIEAMQFNGYERGCVPFVSGLGAMDIVEMFKLYGKAAHERCGGDNNGPTCRFWIDTLEGRMSVLPGSWVIKGVASEHYTCRPDIFEATYEPVP